MKRFVSIILILALVFSCILLPSFAVQSQGKEQIRRSIAIVFDNSGSMYLGSNSKAWCRATYAMEVFASMMNEGDTMTIYPMHSIEIDGRRYDGNTPLTIGGPRDAETIRKMYTPDAQGTPIETISKAYEGLQHADGEKWLIILTDGDQFEAEDGVPFGKGEPTRTALQEKMSGYTSQVNVLYLGIGNEAAMPTMSSGKYQYYGDKAGDSTEVLSKLTYMCNMIFGRDTMRISGNSVSMDVSMRKLIVFVQGKNISNIQLRSSSGSDVGQRVDAHGTRYSEMGSNRGKDVDENLQGMIVTYENCMAGNYQLSYDGEMTSAIAYYEPDVDLVVNFLDENGSLVDPTKDQLTAGEYILQYGLWDNQLDTWTESELLGNTHFEVNYTISNSNGSQPFTASTDERRGTQPVKLEADQELDAVISADYLSGYHLEKSGLALGFPIRISKRLFDAKDFSVLLSGGAVEYPLSQLESLGYYTLTATYQGQSLKAGNGPESFTPIVEIPGCNINVKVEQLSDGSGYAIRLQYHGDARQTDTGDFTLRYGISYTDAHGESGSSSIQETAFSVVNDGYGLTVKLQANQDYYQISEMDTSAPIMMHLAKDGQPLTDEEITALAIEINTGGLPYTTEMRNGQSEIAVHLKNEGNIRPGRYKVSAKATGFDAIGEPISGEDSVDIEVQKYPQWLRWAVAGAILLLLLIILFLILNHKVLPKKVLRNGETDFNIGGKTIEDNAKLSYNRNGKSLEIAAPDAPAYPYVSCLAKLKLEPVSPRRIPSARRQMAVTDVRAGSDISSVEVGAAVYELDKATGRFVKEGSTPTLLSNNSVITINGTAQNSNGKRKTAILSQQLRFR